MLAVPCRSHISICFKASSVSIILLVVRNIFWNNEYSWFLLNLFLAWLPLLFSTLFIQHQKHKVFLTGKRILFGILWLLFYPNAPYIVTDIIHLGEAFNSVPVWFDFILITAFAVTGLLIGYVSLAQLHDVVRRRWGMTVGWIFVGSITVVTSFGIYVGRILRWNSWDMVTHPGLLMSDMIRLIHPVVEPSVIMIILTFSVGLLALYSSLAWLSGSLSKKQ